MILVAATHLLITVEYRAVLFCGVTLSRGIKIFVIQVSSNSNGRGPNDVHSSTPSTPSWQFSRYFLHLEGLPWHYVSKNFRSHSVSRVAAQLLPKPRSNFYTPNYWSDQFGTRDLARWFRPGNLHHLSWHNLELLSIGSMLQSANTCRYLVNNNAAHRLPSLLEGLSMSRASRSRLFKRLSNQLLP